MDRQTGRQTDRQIDSWIDRWEIDSQQPTSPIGFLFLKLPPPPCAVLLVKEHAPSPKQYISFIQFHESPPPSTSSNVKTIHCYDLRLPKALATLQAYVKATGLEAMYACFTMFHACWTSVFSFDSVNALMLVEGQLVLRRRNCRPD